MALADQFTALRAREGFTTDQLAVALGVPERLLIAWEAGTLPQWAAGGDSFLAVRLLDLALLGLEVQTAHLRDALRAQAAGMTLLEADELTTGTLLTLAQADMIAEQIRRQRPSTRLYASAGQDTLSAYVAVHGPQGKAAPTAVLRTWADWTTFQAAHPWAK